MWNVVILTAHATKVNQSEPNWTEPQTRLTCQNQALSVLLSRLNLTGFIGPLKSQLS